MSFNTELFMADGETIGERHISLFLDYVERNETPPASTMQFLAIALKKIKSGTEPKKALQLSKPRGRQKPKGSQIRLEIKIAKLVFGLIQSDKTLEEACLIVADKVHKSHKTIERYYCTHKKTVELELQLDELTERVREFVDALPEEIQNAVGHWPAGNLNQAALLWESDQDLSPEQALSDYWDSLQAD